VILIAMVTGVVLGLLALLPQLISQRRSMGKLQRQIERDAVTQKQDTAHALSLPKSD
jgi:hypothetical protein